MESHGFDLLIVILAIGIFFNGYRKGFIRYISSLVAFILSLVVANAVSPAVVTYVEENTPLETIIENGLADPLNQIMEQTSQESEFLKLFPESIASRYVETANGVTHRLVSYSTTYIAAVVVKWIVFIVLMAFTTAVCKLLFISLDGIAKVPVINTVNRIGGGIAAIGEKIVFLWIIDGFLIMFSKVETIQRIITVMRSNTILNWLYNINPIAKLL